MRILLDTHVFLRWLQDHPNLSAAARTRIVTATDVFVSSASIWEASIKAGIGKLEADIDQLVAEIDNSGFRELPVSARHAAMATRLPDIHRDPFDRILVAQALCEPLWLLTADSLVGGYSELVVTAYGRRPHAATPLWRIMPPCQTPQHPPCAPAAAANTPVAAARSLPARPLHPPPSS